MYLSKNTFWSAVAIIIIAIGGYFAVTEHFFGASAPTPVATSTVATTTTQAVTATANYSCDDGKQISASYAQNSVSLAFSDGRQLTLPQTISGSGIRYEGTSTSSGPSATSTDVVFWSEGDNAFVMENGSSTFQDCLAGTVSPGPSGSMFTDQADTYSFDFPSDLSVTGGGGGYTQSWMVNATTSGMILSQIKVPQSYATGTNFVDAKFTVGTSADPSAVALCETGTAKGGHMGSTTVATIGGLDFTAFHTSSAGAGNYYDTTSYRISRNSQCYAIEYTIHYANIKNFPAKSVKQFDEAALSATLDAIARSFSFK